NGHWQPIFHPGRSTTLRLISKASLATSTPHRPIAPIWCGSWPVAPCRTPARPPSSSDGSPGNKSPFGRKVVHMKLLRYGPAGQEKPGILDNEGQLRDRSGKISDIGGETLSPQGLDALRAI